MEETLYRNHLAILKEELLVALGCTEPIAIAYAGAKARQLLGLDKILLIPAAIPPHKAVAEGSPDGEPRFAC